MKELIQYYILKVGKLYPWGINIAYIRNISGNTKFIYFLLLDMTISAYKYNMYFTDFMLIFTFDFF